jgi:hypothetical protein
MTREKTADPSRVKTHQLGDVLIGHLCYDLVG